MIEEIGKRIQSGGLGDLPPRFRRHLEKRAMPQSHSACIAAAVAEMLEAIDPKAAEKLRTDTEE